jgi:Na+-driven multidrug efflux pump
MATTVRIGYHLGHENIPAAQYIMRLSFAVSSVIGGVNGMT